MMDAVEKERSPSLIRTTPYVLASEQKMLIRACGFVRTENQSCWNCLLTHASIVQIYLQMHIKSLTIRESWFIYSSIRRLSNARI